MPAPVTAPEIRLKQEAQAERYARALLMPEIAFIGQISLGAGSADLSRTFGVPQIDIIERAEDLGCTFGSRPSPARLDRAHLLPELAFLQSIIAGATAPEIAHTQSLEIDVVRARASDLGLKLP